MRSIEGGEGFPLEEKSRKSPIRLNRTLPSDLATSLPQGEKGRKQGCRLAPRLIPTRDHGRQTEKAAKAEERACRAGWKTVARPRSTRREQMVEKIREVYELYGFEAVETPAMEYTDALGKFLPDQDRPNEGVFSFQDDDEQWISLRYDLTAPLARYVAERYGTENLVLPYRSYRFGYVYRNEKPGPGRFRQFMQFDADTIGTRPAASSRGGRCRNVHDGGRHDGSARHPPRLLCGEGE